MTALASLPEQMDPTVIAEEIPRIAKLLLENDAQHNLSPSARVTPLQSAVNSGSIETVDLLLTAGADPSWMIDKRNAYALLLYNNMLSTMQYHRMCRETLLSREQLIETLLEKNMDKHSKAILGAVDWQQGPLLHYAVQGGLLGVVKILLIAGVHVNTYREPTPDPAHFDYVHYGTALDVSTLTRCEMLQEQEKKRKSHSRE